jgi:hypothetical protein
MDGKPGNITALKDLSWGYLPWRPYHGKLMFSIGVGKTQPQVKDLAEQCASGL